MGALIFTGGLQTVLPGRTAIAGKPDNSALYPNLAEPLVAGFYAKLLIPQLGT
jgi:hypothetical protein